MLFTYTNKMPQALVIVWCIEDPLHDERSQEVVRTCCLISFVSIITFPSFLNLVQAGSNKFLVQSHSSCTGTFLRIFVLYYVIYV